MIVSMFLSLPHCALDIFATGKRVNHGGQYGLEIQANFHFYVPQNTIKLVKKSNKDQRKLKQNCKTLSKVTRMQFSYNKWFIWPSTWRVYYKEIYARGNAN